MGAHKDNGIIHVVHHWRKRAKAAEARVEVLERLLRDLRDDPGTILRPGLDARVIEAVGRIDFGRVQDTVARDIENEEDFR